MTHPQLDGLRYVDKSIVLLFYVYIYNLIKTSLIYI